MTSIFKPLFALAVSLLCFSTAKSQFSIDTIVPPETAFNPCNSYTFSVDITDLGGSDALELDFTLSSFQSLTASNIGTITGNTIQINGADTTGSFTLEYTIAIGCVFDASAIPSGHSFDWSYNSGALSGNRATSYDINTAVISFMEDDSNNLIFSSALAGVPVGRTFVYQNTGLTAFTGVIRFVDTTVFDYSGSGVRFVGSASASSSTAGVITGVPSITVNDTTVIIEIHVDGLPSNQTITFSDSVLLVSCPSGSIDNSQTRYHSTYGCDSTTLCKKIGDDLSTTSTKFNENIRPGIHVELLTTGYNNCALENKERLVRIINTGAGSADSLSFTFAYNATSITTIDLDTANIILSWDVAGTNRINYTQTSGIKLSNSTLATFESNVVVASWDTLYLRYTELMTCLDTSQYASLFNSEIKAHYEMVSITLSHPCYPTSATHPQPYQNSNWQHTFGLTQNFESIVPMMIGKEYTGGVKESFIIANSTALDLGRKMEGFIYSMDSAALKLQLILEPGLELVDSIRLNSFDNATLVTLSPYQQDYFVGSSGIGSGDTAIVYFRFREDFYNTFSATNTGGFVDAPTSRFIKFFSSFTVDFDLLANCTFSGGGKVKITEQTFFIPDTTCMDCILPLSNVSSSVSVNCPGCKLPGWNMHRFDIERQNFGLQDNDNNNYPDNTIVPYALAADTNLVKRERIMIGDTVLFRVHGHTTNGETSASDFDHLTLDEGQFAIQGAIIDSLDFLGAEGTYFIDATTYNFTIPSTAGVYHSNGFGIDMGITALESYVGGSIGVSKFGNGHRIELRALFRVRGNLTSGTEEAYYSAEDFNTIINMSGEPFLDSIAQVGSLEDANEVFNQEPDGDAYFALTPAEKNALFYWCTQGLGRVVAIGADFKMRVESQDFNNNIFNEDTNLIINADEQNPCYKVLYLTANTNVGKPTSLGVDLIPDGEGNQKVWNSFSFELRNLWMLDSVTFPIPTGMAYDHSYFVLAQLKRDTINNTTAYNGGPSAYSSYVKYTYGDEVINTDAVTIYPSKNFDKITQAKDFTNFAGYDETKRILIFVKYKYTDSCEQIADVTDISLDTTITYWSNFPSVGDTIIYVPVDGNGIFNKPSATLLTQVTNQQESSTSPNISWDINLEVPNADADNTNLNNYVQERAENSFVYVVYSSNLSNLTLSNRINGIPYPVSTTVGGYPLFQVGDLGANGGSFINAATLLTADFDCTHVDSTDTLYIVTGWSCYDYPTYSLEEACFLDTTMVVITLPETGLQAEVVLPESNSFISPCTSEPYSLSIKATGLGDVDNISIKMTLPNDGLLTYVPNSAFVELFPNPVEYIEPDILLLDHTWYLDSADFMQDFSGADTSAYLNLNLIATCGFVEGNVRFEIIGENFCSKLVPSSSIVLNHTVRINPTTYTTDTLVLDLSATDMQSCQDSTQVVYTVTNTGSSPSSGTANSLTINLPTGFSASTSSATVISYTLPVINPTESFTDTLYLLNSTDNTCGIKELTALINADVSYFCATDSTTCFGEVSIATDTTIFNVLPPSGFFSVVNDTLCVGDTLVIDSVSMNCVASETWDFGDETPEVNGSVTSHVYADLGSYLITRTVYGSDSTCIGIDSLRVLIQELSVFAGNDTTICVGDSITLTATSPVSGGTFIWAENGTTISTTESVTVSPTTTTTYVAHYTSGNCSATDTIVVNVSTGISGFTYDLYDKSENDTVWFTAIGSAPSYTWDFGDGTIETNGINPYYHIYEYPGYYQVFLSTSGGSCGNDTLTDIIYIIPSTSAYNPNPECLRSYIYTDTNITVSSNEIWNAPSTPITIKGTLTVEAGATLTIQNITVNFGPEARIIVEPRGHLVLNNATLTGIDFGSCGNRMMWMGVEVWGNALLGTQAAQGHITLQSGARIEDAHTAVLLGRNEFSFTGTHPEFQYSFHSTTQAGGYITATASTFNRNATAIKGWEGAGENRIDLCTFICKTGGGNDTDLLDPYYNPNNAEGNYGDLRFSYGSHNPFYLMMPTGDTTASDLGRAKYSIYLFGRNKNSYITTNVFEHVDTPIEVFDSYISVTTGNEFNRAIAGVRIMGASTSKLGSFIGDNDANNQNIFRNIDYGIESFGTENLKVKNNIFNDPNNPSLINPLRFCYMHESFGFELVDNQILRAEIGIWVFNSYLTDSWVNYEESGNLFQQCFLPFIASGNNGEHLILKCNRFENPQQVAGEYSGINWDVTGKFRHQGDFSLTDRKKPAGNTYDFNNQAAIDGQLYVNVPRNKPRRLLYYRHHTDNFTTPELVDSPFDGSPSATNNFVIRPNPVDFVDYETSCDPVVNPLCIQCLDDALSFAKVSIDDLNTEYAAVLTTIDGGGETQMLLDNVYQDPPPGNLKDLLIAHSPLSDTVLTAYLLAPYNKPSGILKEVMQPNMPVSDVVEPSLEYAYTFTSAGVVNDLRPRQIENPNFRTLTAIERELDAAQDDKALYLTNLSMYYASVDSIELAVALLEQESDTAYFYGLVGTYIKLQDFGSASATLALIPDETIEDQAFHDLYSMHIALGLDDKNLWQMSATQEAMVRDIAMMCPSSLASTNAKAILRLVFGESVAPCQGTGARIVYTDNNATYPLEMSSLEEEKDEFVLGNNIPNPFSQVTTIPYKFPEGVTKAELVITDFLGRKLNSYKLNKESNSLEINMTDYKAGIYFYSLVIDGAVVQSKRMVLIK